MDKTLKISDSEWQVMKIVWGKSPVTSTEIVEILKGRTEWSATTIYTLINRLVKKGAIGIEEGSSPNICYPLIEENDFKREESKSFLKKVFDGSLNLMLVNFLKDEKLTDEEIEELKRILDKSKN